MNRLKYAVTSCLLSLGHNSGYGLLSCAGTEAALYGNTLSRCWLSDVWRVILHQFSQSLHFIYRISQLCRRICSLFQCRGQVVVMHALGLLRPFYFSPVHSLLPKSPSSIIKVRHQVSRALNTNLKPRSLLPFFYLTAIINGSTTNIRCIPVPDVSVAEDKR